MASLLPNAKQQFLDANGKPLASGSVYFYIPGTTQFKSTWQDSAQTLLNPNPVPLDAAGSAIIWGAGQYRQQVFDQFGNLIWDQLTTDTSGASLVAVSVNVKSYGAAGDGITNDTVAINNAITAGAGGIVYFPPGKYLYNGGASLPQGTTLIGSGRYSSVIVPALAAPVFGFLFNVANEKSSIKSLGFAPSLTSPAQTSGYYVKLSGDESFIEDFYMEAFFGGIYMNGSLNKARNGRMWNGLTNAVGITTDGGDNSPTIDSVAITAGPVVNRAKAGIMMLSSTALTINDVSVLQQGTGLLVTPPANTNIFSLLCSNSFFDTCNYAAQFIASNGSGIYRFRFVNCWFGSAQVGNGVTISSTDTSVITGINFEQCQFVLSVQSGAYLSTTGTAVVAQIRFYGSTFAGNTGAGLWINNQMDKLRVVDCDFGPIDGFTQNGNADLVLQATCTNVMIENNQFGSATTVANPGNASGIMRSNLGVVTESKGLATLNSGATSVTVNHGLSVAPAQADISFGFSSSAAGATNLALTAWNATQLTFSVTAAPSSNAAIWWNVRTALAQ